MLLNKVCEGFAVFTNFVEMQVGFVQQALQNGTEQKILQNDQPIAVILEQSKNPNLQDGLRFPKTKCKLSIKSGTRHFGLELWQWNCGLVRREGTKASPHAAFWRASQSPDEPKAEMDEVDLAREYRGLRR